MVLAVNFSSNVHEDWEKQICMADGRGRVGHVMIFWTLDS